ncbi:zinc finger protein 37 homolog [Stomoxys calcitrans]|uniref:C2H2-type domain-containing protein n=1 Tax=Stomoxys calcitrans TaxID=35570 RepID=A0A1I8PWM8_STOCA|nr:zinc finger protein 37 homolog [Stomoxys calcitrans]
MSAVNICRLCVNVCSNYKRLYDDTEVYDITVKYFDPMFLNLKSHNALCFDCWCHIVDFHNFQQNVALAQNKFTDKEILVANNAIKSEILNQTLEESNAKSLFHQDVCVKNEPPELEPESATDDANDHLVVPELLFSVDELESLASLKHTTTANTKKRKLSDADNGAKITSNLSSEQHVNLKKALVKKVMNQFNNSFNKPTTTPTTNKVPSGHNKIREPLNDISRKNLAAAVSSTSQMASNDQQQVRAKSAKMLDKLIANYRSLLRCELCTMHFSTFTLLQDHHREKHANEEFFILCCERKFYLRSRLEKHLRSHSGDPIKCHGCGRCFTWKITLSRHIRKCPQVLQKQRQATAKPGLNPHLKPHIVKGQAMKRYQCNVCEKSYTKNHSLREHMAVHTGDSLYSCSHCPETFIYRSSWRMHQLRQHAGLRKATQKVKK